MADTLDNVPLPANVWVDLYAATGLAVGVALSAQNVGTTDVRLAVQAAQPPADHDGYVIIQRDPGLFFRNNIGDAGAWALSPHADGKLNVQALA